MRVNGALGRRPWLTAVAILIVFPIVAQAVTLLLVVPFVMWVAPHLEAQGSFPTSRSHQLAAWSLNLAGIAGAIALCYAGWRRLSGTLKQ